ncbi:MAG: type II toxin-antitoxin system VapC family toxin [Mucilaginibacter sp.]|nr:type II toxin-antitoxin system VapC family toxin [Mucilaginibacter sp.]
MTGNKCFLDTSVIIHFFKSNASIIELLKTFQEVYVSNIVVGELYYGAYASSNATKHIQQIQDFLTDCIIVSPDLDASIAYGKLKADLKRKGSPIPENDIWIAAIAIEQNIPLFTTDNHFKLLDLDLIFR